MDYQALGITANDIPGLIQIATDLQLFKLDIDTIACWAVVHAWRALGQLQAISAVEPLLELCDRETDIEIWWEWALEELPLVFSLIGEPTLPILTHYLDDLTQPAGTRGVALAGVELLAKRTKTESVKQRCIVILTEALTHFAENDLEFNGFLVGTLVDLGAVESAPIIQQAFAANRVNDGISGDWESVQIDLGLISSEGSQTQRFAQGNEALRAVDEFLRSPLPDLNEESQT